MLKYKEVIRVESEETQDYVCEMLTISPEEAEELAFVPGALSEPRGAIHFCDNRCSEEAVRYRQFASTVVEEDGEARTVNLCLQCHNGRRAQQGESRLNLWQWRAVVETKAHGGIIWRIMGNERFARGIWEYFTLKRAEAKNIRDDAARGRRNLLSGRSWSRPNEMKIWDAAQKSCGKGFFAIRDCRWENFKVMQSKREVICMGPVNDT